MDEPRDGLISMGGISPHRGGTLRASISQQFHYTRPSKSRYRDKVTTHCLAEAASGGQLPAEVVSTVPKQFARPRAGWYSGGSIRIDPKMNFARVSQII